ncbi:MAG: beta-propeller fold lactonase family protein [Myxococcota bacterium]
MLSRRAMVQVLASGAALLVGAGCRKKAHGSDVWVSAEDSGELVCIDADKAVVAARVSVGKRPRGVKASRDGKLLYVALSGSPRGGPNVDESKLPPAERAADGIGVVDATSRKLVRTHASGQDPESFDLSLDGKLLYVSNEETAELSVLDLAAGKVVQQVKVGEEPEGVTLRPDGKAVYVTCEADRVVVALDTSSLKELARIPTGMRPRAIAFDVAGTTGFVSSELSSELTVFDTKSHSVIHSIKLEEPGKAPRPMGCVVSPDGRWLYVSNGRAGSVAVVDVAARRVAAIIADVGARPWGIGISADGKRVFTANGPSNDVSIIDTGTRSVVQRVKVGGSPWGIVVPPSA